MVTFIIAAVIVGILSLLLRGVAKGNETVRAAKDLRKTNETFLPNMLELETFGFTVHPLDEAVRATLEKGRANPEAYLPNADTLTIEETIEGCCEDKESYDRLKRGIETLEANCNVKVTPDIREEVERYRQSLRPETE